MPDETPCFAKEFCNVDYPCLRVRIPSGTTGIPLCRRGNVFQRGLTVFAVDSRMTDVNEDVSANANTTAAVGCAQSAGVTSAPLRSARRALHLAHSRSAAKREDDGDFGHLV